ncbi:MAG: hypothetical protein IV100_26675 [Myxococcales bacterium]|nr:hypothetical protein [Myxococcales bacterium]
MTPLTTHVLMTGHTVRRPRVGRVVFGMACLGLAATSVTPLSAQADPPPAVDRSARIARVETILALGRSQSTADVALLIRNLTGAVTSWERAAAIKALKPHHRELAIPSLQTLIDDKDPVIALEATVVLHRFRPSPQTLARLERLRDRGARLRSAFQKGETRGRPDYTDEGIGFFTRGLAHPLLEARLDSALGLLEAGGDHKAPGLEVLEKAMHAGSATDRLTAVRFLQVPYDDDALIAILDRAKEDPDEQVRLAASNIQARRSAKSPGAPMSSTP